MPLLCAAYFALLTENSTLQQALYTLNGGVPMSSKTSQQVTIPASLGTNGQYFIKFVETTTTGQVVVTYSGRFTLTGMIGSLVASTGLSTNAPPGTTPAAVTNTATTTPTTATTGTVQTSPLGTGALQAYATQTGLTRSAPPQRKPGRSITADPDAAQPLYQTSAYKPFQTFGATPVVMTTLIPSQTWTLTSYENQATPAQFVAGAHL